MNTYRIVTWTRPYGRLRGHKALRLGVQDARGPVVTVAHLHLQVRGVVGSRWGVELSGDFGFTLCAQNTKHRA